VGRLAANLNGWFSFNIFSVDSLVAWSSMTHMLWRLAGGFSVFMLCCLKVGAVRTEMEAVFRLGSDYL
jgi:hypothetical protein